MGEGTLPHANCHLQEQAGEVRAEMSNTWSWVGRNSRVASRGEGGRRLTVGSSLALCSVYLRGAHWFVWHRRGSLLVQGGKLTDTRSKDLVGTVQTMLPTSPGSWARHFTSRTPCFFSPWRFELFQSEQALV